MSGLDQTRDVLFARIARDKRRQDFLERFLRRRAPVNKILGRGR
jgi:hypothetical protein